MNDLKKIEPYRVLFPIGLVFGCLGVYVWVAYALFEGSSYPVQLHSHLMMGSFLFSFVAGFLMTAVPKMTAIDAVSGCMTKSSTTAPTDPANGISPSWRSVRVHERLGHPGHGALAIVHAAIILADGDPMIDREADGQICEESETALESGVITQHIHTGEHHVVGPRTIGTALRAWMGVPRLRLHVYEVLAHAIS